MLWGNCLFFMRNRKVAYLKLQLMSLVPKFRFQVFVISSDHILIELLNIIEGF